MPAHRSEAEAEIREAVVAKLRRLRPGARIINEINVLDGRVRVDVMAVDRAEIITVEIKSERDKLDRLPTQLDAMRRTSHTPIAALHRKFMPDPEATLAPRLDFMPYDQLVWWYPTAQDMAEAHHPAFTWRDPDPMDHLQKALPPEAMSLLHSHEMKTVCAEVGLSLPPRSNMKSMERFLRWGATGRQITLGICKALRAREWAAEADPPILDV